MSPEYFIIEVYCLVHDVWTQMGSSTSLRQRGPQPLISDPELITMEIVGEYLGCGSDQAIWKYIKRHWMHLFPSLPSRTSFIKQSANLSHMKIKIQSFLTQRWGQDQDLYLFDGFPIPICHIKRYKRSRNMLTIDGEVGYCAAKNEFYYGFKGHLLVTQRGMIRAYDIAPALADERDLLEEVALTWKLKGDVLADKGLISRALHESLEDQHLHLHTPLRSNMKDPRPKAFVSQIMDIRRRVETVIGQLTERFQIQCIRAKDLWHLCSKVGRKLLAHTACFALNLKLNPDNPLQLELLVT